MAKKLAVFLALAALACSRGEGNADTTSSDPDAGGPEDVPAERALPRSSGVDAGADLSEPAESAVRLPEDSAPHGELVEWWYWTGHLEPTDADAGEAGRSWGFELAIFQQDLAVFGGSGHGYMCHAALTEKHLGEHHHVSRLALQPDELTHEAPVILDLFPCYAKLDGQGGDHVMGSIRPKSGPEKDDTWSFDIQTSPLKPVVLHGGDGVIAMGAAGGDSYYYSYTRTAASGRVETPEGDFEVRGQGWMDHQWGDFDINAFKGWDWWSVQLDDDWELMLFEFRDWEGVVVSRAGSIVDPRGRVTELSGLEAFTITALREWESPHTDGVYPLDWDIAIPGEGWSLAIRVDIDDQEMPNIVQDYWEGPVTVTGKRREAPVTGVGYVELTGYATDIGDPK